MEQKYPTREQAQNISTSTCDHEDCDTCEIKRWCCYEDAGRECGASMLAMHDEIDRLRGNLRDVQGELLDRFDNHELPDLNMVEIAQRIDKWLSTDEAGD